MSRRKKQKVVFMVVSIPKVKQIILIDVIAGTAVYYAFQFSFQSTGIATAVSMVFSSLVRRELRRRNSSLQKIPWPALAGPHVFRTVRIQ
ncbi:hypothetical protein [Paenibacillus gansuensis]|uniref:Uncharacterized protein n=1 Tax=Paenibacillus gansuensis TaxID=306542 RepID=A0ABW5PID7_9BACL